MVDQWQPIEVLIDTDDSKLDQSITYKMIGVQTGRLDGTEVSNLPKAAIVEPITPIFPPSHYMRTARELLAQGWVSGYEARDQSKKSVEPEDESAVEWCIIGAKKASLKYAPPEFKQYMLRYLESMFNAANPGVMIEHPWVWEVNDPLPQHKGQQVVVAMMDRAVTFLEKHPEFDKWPEEPSSVNKLGSSEYIKK